MKRIIEYYLVIIIVLGTILTGCKKETIPVVTTISVSNITATTAASGGNITDDGNSTISTRGVCWSTGITPTIGDNKTFDGAGAGSYSSEITELNAGTIYYVRAYATNSIGTGYGMAMSFTSQPAIIPVLTTADVSAITQNTATCGGIITSDGAASIIASGVCWSTSLNPTITDSKTTESSGLGTFESSITGLTPNTFYYVRAYATNSVGTAYGNQVSFTTLALSIPELITLPLSSLISTTATSGGNITSDGGAAISACGVCWSTATGPTIALSTKTTDGTGTGEFTSSISGLALGGTPYYLRAYATNSIGTAYGNQISFITSSEGTFITDIDGNIYKTVTIGMQVWMAENLKTTKYRNGDLIGTTSPSTLDISGEITPKYQWAYEGNESNVETYGRLYTWYAATDSRKVCPTGWHLPTDEEWTTLTDYLTNNGYGYDVTGTQIAKSIASKTGWSSSSVVGSIGNYQANNNSSGFTALPSGYRYFYGSFSSIGNYSYWWSSTEFDATYAWYRYIYFNSCYVSRYYYNKRFGWSVRCLRDN
jgi:uncharacterized protein (TIGR02145 family)